MGSAGVGSGSGPKGEDGAGTETGIGMGELGATVDVVGGSAAFTPVLLFSLAFAVLLSLALLPLGREAAASAVPFSSDTTLGFGARQEGSSHTTPVKLLS